MLELKAHMVQRLAVDHLLSHTNVTGTFQGFTLNIERTTAPKLLRLFTLFLQSDRRVAKSRAQMLLVISELQASAEAPAVGTGTEVTSKFMLKGMAINFVNDDALLFDAFLQEAELELNLAETGHLRVSGKLGDVVVENHSEHIGVWQRGRLEGGCEGYWGTQGCQRGASAYPNSNRNSDNDNDNDNMRATTRTTR